MSPLETHEMQAGPHGSGEESVQGRQWWLRSLRELHQSTRTPGTHRGPSCLPCPMPSPSWGFPASPQPLSVPTACPWEGWPCWGAPSVVLPLAARPCCRPGAEPRAVAMSGRVVLSWVEGASVAFSGLRCMSKNEFHPSGGG